MAEKSVEDLKIEARNHLKALRKPNGGNQALHLQRGIEALSAASDILYRKHWKECDRNTLDQSNGIFKLAMEFGSYATRIDLPEGGFQAYDQNFRLRKFPEVAERYTTIFSQREHIKDTYDRRERERKYGGTQGTTSFVASIVGIVGAGIFLSAGITGNAIAEMSVGTSNWIGAGFLLLAIVGGWFWVRARRAKNAMKALVSGKFKKKGKK